MIVYSPPLIFYYTCIIMCTVSISRAFATAIISTLSPTAGGRTDPRRETQVPGKVSEVHRPRVILRVHGELGDAEGIAGRALSRWLLDEQLFVSVHSRRQYIRCTVRSRRARVASRLNENNDELTITCLSVVQGIPGRLPAGEVWLPGVRPGQSFVLLHQRGAEETVFAGPAGGVLRVDCRSSDANRLSQSLPGHPAEVRL